MSESKQLTKRQSAVIEDLFTQNMEEQQVLEKHHVKRREYDRWLADERFTCRIEQRIAHACRRSRMILAQHAAEAARKLVELTQSGQGETARKACLDIIALHGDQMSSSDAGASKASASPGTCALTPEMAGRLLAALAQGQHDGDSPESGRKSQEVPELR